MIRILVLEDDPIASSSLRSRLEMEGYLVDCFDEAEQAIQACEEVMYDLLILDVTIHGSILDGVEVASFIRKKHSTPFIFVTASGSEEAHIRGLGAGAIAYVQKPVSHKALVLQIQNILKTYNKDEALKYKDYKFDLIRNTIEHNGNTIRLSQKPMELLVYLIRNYGKVISKKELSEQIWPGEALVTDDVINNTITRIRRELGDHIIITYRGKGYEIQP